MSELIDIRKRVSLIDALPDLMSGEVVRRDGWGNFPAVVYIKFNGEDPFTMIFNGEVERVYLPSDKDKVADDWYVIDEYEYRRLLDVYTFEKQFDLIKGK